MTIGEMDPNFKEKWDAIASPPVRLIIAGGRDFNDLPLVKISMAAFCNEHFAAPNQITIISGMCRGADILGCDWARTMGSEIVKMPAWWRGEDNNGPYNKAAGYQRNERMARDATHLIAFWDGKSKGTGHMIDLGVQYNLKTKVVNYV